jgi:hypothetical protein
MDRHMRRKPVSGVRVSKLESVVLFGKKPETIALLKILALGNGQIRARKTKSARSAVKKVRERHRK